MIDWTRVRHFAPAEWGDWARVDSRLISTLDDYREYLGRPVVLGDALVVAGHSPTGQHPTGHAIDCHVTGLPLLDAWLAAERFPAFLGIGVYPWWTHPGLHLETQNEARTPYRARWWRDRDGTYRALDASDLYHLMTRHGFAA